ncbi:threonine-phosphate decarboxylase CobD [Methanolobus halotolerans]|uniref:threonine-phosphate decarboxylase n=1 Tax=Methanolobus halotolerans TaxID=2052935 RepID=A0A4E0PVG2_9EURY|nr:threonine-phosphate decarboxylase CobD [Methanolobus halotolerans]TGC09129.1 threonine-phosphate decarboxylase [Methanolobus halotolerans]
MSKNTAPLPVKEYLRTLEPGAHGGLIRKSSQEHAIPESEILDASASLNPFGTPFEYSYTGLKLKSLLDKGLEKMEQYPDNRYLEFREAAARFTGMGVRSENIIPGNGSTEIIRLVAECVIEEGDTVLIPQPTFSEYEVQCKVLGANIRYIRQEELGVLDEDLLEDAKILFVCNPNNPTGILFTREQIAEMAHKCAKHHTLLFVDEAFIELADHSQSVADMVEGNAYLFIQRSLTKAFAIPGIRMGFGIASTAFANVLNNARLSWNMGCIADTVATALLNMEGGVDSKYLVDSRGLIETERAYLMQKLTRRGFKPFESSVNYIFIDISEFSMNSTELAERMASHGVLIRDCSSFQEIGNNYIRVAVRTREENERLVSTIKQVINEWGKQQAESMLETNLAKAADCGRLGSNLSCEYYPCHFEGQDCTFCFCPFYPCKDERTGGQWIESSSGGDVWSCLYCDIIHKPEVVDDVLSVLVKEGRNKESIKKAWKNALETRL